MPKKLYVSHDNGEIYKPEHLDNPDDPGEGFWPIEVPEIITLTANQICGGNGSIVEILVRANQAKKL